MLVGSSGFEDMVLWAGAGAMFLGTAIYLYLGRNVAMYEDKFFIMAVSITVIAGTAYLAMALGMGRVEVHGEEVLAARYLDWMLTTPLLLILLGMLANANRETVGLLIGLDVYMIVTGFLGVLAEPLWQKLVWWGVSTASFLVLLYLLLTVLSKGASKQPDDLVGVYRSLRNLTVVLWSLYPIVWVAGGTGFGLLSAQIELVSYATLDVLAKVAFGLILLNSHETIRVQSFYVQKRVEKDTSAVQGGAGA